MKGLGTEEDRTAALTQQIRLLARQTARSEAELQRLREALATSHRELEHRTAELVKRLDELQAAANAQEIHQHVKIDELTKTNRILTDGLKAIEKCIGRLSKSRSFRFLAYGLSRLGLISHTPRCCLESIKDQLVAIRDAVRQVKSDVVAHAADREPVEMRSNHSATCQGSAFLSSTRHEPFVPPDYADVEGGKTGPAESGRDLVSNQPAAGTCPIDDENRNRRIEQAAHFRALACSRNLVSLPPLRQMGDDPSVCFIVLHRGGENHLRQLFGSFLEVNTWSNVECAVVLHSCTDNSRDVIKSFQNRLKIKVIEYDKNYSFAYSNNRAAEQTSAEYLVFCNNDIVFRSNVIPELLRLLGDSRNGVVGTRLLFPPDHSKYPNGLQHGGVKFRPDRLHFFHRPWNVGVHIDNFDTPAVPEEFPAVTGALAACRRRDFLKVGGFCESYFYGYEDVDLCLSFRRILGLRSISANHVASIHSESATGGADNRETIIQRRSNNIIHLIRRHGWYLRRHILADKVAGRLFFSDQPLTVAFAVTDSKPTTAAGDFFTALELAEACEREFGWKIRYLSRQKDWYNLQGIDVLVTLLDPYDISKIREAKPDLIKIAWMRNWFERWASRPDFDQYDLYLCSSIKSAEWLRKTHRKPAWVFPLATNPARFTQGKSNPRLRSDYCFTGSSYWQTQRDIESAVQPQELEGQEFAVFGAGWESQGNLGAYARGFRPYDEMPDVYASTRIVIDDADSATKEWGSVNSRVFDALAAGALIVTNGRVGAAEFFDRQLPSYGSPEELQSVLRHYLHNEEERQRLVAKLRERVLSRHTYRHRARTLKRILIDRARRAYRIAFKIGAPNLREAPHWGDYHFARSLGRCFAEMGHSFRIDCLDEWERPEAFGDDVVIVLSGLSRYRPKPGQINFIWNISHPDKIEDAEYEEFDHVFVASRIYAADLARRLRTPVNALLQCTDPEIFFPESNPEVPHENLLFVGNSRKQYREVVRLAVEAKMPIGVYGTHWPMFIPAGHIRGEYIDNSVLRQHYSQCDILLNDHWPTMRERGFISNRLFDAAAAGAFVISDAVEGGGEVFGEDLVTYQSEAEFHEKVEYYLARPQERRARAERLRSRVLSAHTFAHRTAIMLERIREIDRRKRGTEGPNIQLRRTITARETAAIKV